jgi:hypothetical protein
MTNQAKDWWMSSSTSVAQAFGVALTTGS